MRTGCALKGEGEEEQPTGGWRCSLEAARALGCWCARPGSTVAWPPAEGAAWCTAAADGVLCCHCCWSWLGGLVGGLRHGEEADHRKKERMVVLVDDRRGGVKGRRPGLLLWIRREEMGLHFVLAAGWGCG